MPGGPSLVPGGTSHQVQQMVQTLVQTRVTHLLLEWNQKRVLETEKLCQRK